MATPPVFSAGAVLTASQMNKVGLWLVDEQSFSATPTWKVTSVFTSDFKNYRLVLNCTTGTGAAAQIQGQMLVGTTATGGVVYYNHLQGIMYSGTVENTSNNGASNWYCVRTNGDEWSNMFDIFNPQVAKKTFFTSLGQDTNQRYHAGGYINNSTQYDGIQFHNSGNHNMTGTVAVYGYRNE